MEFHFSMDIRHLRVFVEVVRHDGFSAAARAIHASQPTVSKAIALLEEEVGMPLMERDRHGVRLTQAGEVVYRRAQAVLNEREDLLAELAELKGLHRGELRIGLPMLGSDILFAPLLAAYRAGHPGIDLQLLEQGSEALEDSLLAERVWHVTSLPSFARKQKYSAILFPAGARLLPLFFDIPSVAVVQDILSDAYRNSDDGLLTGMMKWQLKNQRSGLMSNSAST